MSGLLEREIAFLDVREIMPFGAGHPLLATHLPLGHIECEIAGLVPRRDTRIIVTDGGDGLSATLTASSAALLGDFEAVFLVGVGLAHKTPFRVHTLHDPTRIVVDVHH